MGKAVYTVDELVLTTGSDRSLANELWLALGFPIDVEQDDQRVYAQLDAEMLRSLEALLSLELADRERVLAMTRVMGQAMARLAAAQVELFGEEMNALVERDSATVVDDEVRAGITELLVPGIERFVAYCWRRHLLAALDRKLDNDESGVVVGFVDVVDFTRTTRQVGEDELAEIVARFERHVYETVTNSGARLRKLLGDGVMFDAPDAATAAGAALALVMRCAEDPRLPGARGGLAAGPTLELEGDIYGDAVNRASRLAGMAFPNTVIADREVGDDVHGQAGFVVRHIGSRPVKGLGRVDVSVIRAALI